MKKSDFIHNLQQDNKLSEIDYNEGPFIIKQPICFINKILLLDSNNDQRYYDVIDCNDSPNGYAAPPSYIIPNKEATFFIDLDDFMFDSLSLYCPSNGGFLDDSISYFYDESNSTISLMLTANPDNLSLESLWTVLYIYVREPVSEL